MRSGFATAVNPGESIKDFEARTATQPETDHETSEEVSTET